MPDALPRHVLPIHVPPAAAPPVYDAKASDATFAPITQVRPPAEAPNVVVILLDDVGFGAPSTFGGAVATPTADRLAGAGLRFNRFHTTALCAPTRSALLTGRNHHAVGMGAITEVATAAPGYTSVRPDTAAPLAEVLRLNGYSTAQFGKCHEVPTWETSPMGPFDRWPTGSGFEHFFGFLGGETNQWYPALYEGTTPVEPWGGPEDGYHFTEDMTDRAIAWVRQQRSLMTDKPFFLYVAPGAAHAPHQVPAEWSEKYRGRFDAGWDALREEVFARQKELGVIPADAELTPRPDEIPAWDDMPDELRPVLTRQMEVFAGFLEHTDHHIGRLVDAIDELGALDDTLVFYVLGDNGASAEGTVNGSMNETYVFNNAAHLETPEMLLERLDDFGGPDAYNHYAVGWAHATSTPFQWTKQVASHWGGTRNGMVVHWPKGIEAPGAVRDQFHHVIDIAPTILDAAGIPQPTSVHGVAQQPVDGRSMTPTFGADAAEAEGHRTQYFEMFCNRGIYHEGWTAVTRHSTPWIVEELPDLDDDVWELYAPTDWSQRHDLAAEHPDKLAELQRLFLLEAARNNVLPLDDRRVERFLAVLAGRPELVSGSSQLLFSGMGRLTEHTVLNVKNRSHAVTADLEVTGDDAHGVVVAQGGRFGGWSVYFLDGRLHYCHNLFGARRFVVAATEPMPAGRHQVRMEFAYDGVGLGLGGDVRLFLDGDQVGEGRVDATVPLIYSMDETCDVGHDTASPVTEDYAGDSHFRGRIHWVQLDVDEAAADADHLITPEERFRIAMARQ